ncbi:Snd3p [Sporobolomyces salmoneus]|uniref:Snd3p n=1 Tax=Sporobolomyces salmoneus TaxID=183962 RepID=UPI00317BDC0E
MPNPAITNLMVSLGAMQIARKIDFEDPQVLLYVRCLYVGAQLLSLGVYYYATLKIKQKNDLKVLKYTEPAKPMGGDGPTTVTTTVRDYDLSQASSAVRSVLVGCAFMAFMHLYMKYTQPLFIQGIMPLKSLFDSKILKIHLFGQPATGDLKRPFEAPAGMFGTPAASSSNETTETPAVEAKKEAKKDK